MKVIFLDVDGVLNSSVFLEVNKPEYRGSRQVVRLEGVIIDRKNVAVLKEIIEKTGAAIVLSSGWKFRFDEEMKPQTEEAGILYSILDEYGIRLYGKTPDFSTEEIRRELKFSKVKAKEIKAWMGMHKDIDSFIVLDDLDLNDEEINSRLIRINSVTGFTEHDVASAILMLEH